MCVYVTERYMEMHMKHEHRDAHLCVCVSWRVMWGGGKPEEEYPPHPSCLSSPLLKEGGSISKCFIHPAAEYSYAFHFQAR